VAHAAGHRCRSAVSLRRAATNSSTAFRIPSGNSAKCCETSSLDARPNHLCQGSSSRPSRASIENSSSVHPKKSRRPGPRRSAACPMVKCGAVSMRLIVELNEMLLSAFIRSFEAAIWCRAYLAAFSRTPAVFEVAGAEFEQTAFTRHNPGTRQLLMEQIPACRQQNIRLASPVHHFAMVGVCSPILAEHVFERIGVLIFTNTTKRNQQQAT